MQQQQGKPTSKPNRFNAVGPCANVFMSANTGSWRLERPKVDFGACSKCGTCKRYCPAAIIEIHKDQEECVTFDWNYCKGCGICANECPKHCIQMVDERGEA